MKVLIGKKRFELIDGTVTYTPMKVFSSLSEYHKDDVKDSSAKAMLSKAIRTGKEFDGLYWSYEYLDNDIVRTLLQSHWLKIGNTKTNLRLNGATAKALLTYDRVINIIEGADGSELFRPAVYGIFKNDEIVYIGSTQFPISRIIFHLSGHDEWQKDFYKNYKQYSWKILEQQSTNWRQFEREEQWIRKMQPKYNKNYNHGTKEV